MSEVRQLRLSPGRHPSQAEDQLHLADLQSGLHADVGRGFPRVAQLENPGVKGIGRRRGRPRFRLFRGAATDGFLEGGSSPLGLGHGLAEPPDLLVETFHLEAGRFAELLDEAREIASDRLPGVPGGAATRGDEEQGAQGDDAEADEHGIHGTILHRGHAVCKTTSETQCRGVGRRGPAPPALPSRNRLT